MPRIVKHPLHNLIIPAFTVALSMTLLVVVLNTLNFDLERGIGASAIIFASFAGSAFTLFMVPRVKAASTKRFLKSYFIGGTLGLIGYVLLPYLRIYAVILLMMFACSLLLIITDSMHPPAMGMLFAFILYDIGYSGIVVVISGVAVLVIVRLVLEKLVFELENDVERLERKRKTRGA